MSEFTRRPHLEGATASDILTQPHIIGSISRDLIGEVPGLAAVLPAELNLETEAGSVAVTINPSALLSDVVDYVNTQAAGLAEAEDRDGCILVRTLGSGEGAYIRILQATAFTDSAPFLGLPTHPHPLATAMAGKQAQSPPRPDYEGNPAGTAFLAQGEDRVARAYNRALSKMARSADYLHVLLSTPVAVPFVIDVTDVAFWNPARMTFNVDGELTKIDLSNLAALYPSLAGKRFYVGGLTGASTPEEIAEYWAILDAEYKELLSEDDIIRISEVTCFHGNALGVDWTKETVGITEVRYGSTINCAGALFITNGVVAGDKAVISGSTLNVPFNHNGTYVVETVVSEEELVLRPASTANLNCLNNGPGVFGTVTVSSGGEFESGLSVTFDPPVPHFPPEAGFLRLLLGVEAPLGEVPVSSFLTSTIRTSEEVSGYVLREIQRRLTLDGVYDAMSANKGAGFNARVDLRSFLLNSLAGRESAITGALNRSTTGEILTGNTLRIDSPDFFSSADAGRTVKVTGAGYLAEEPFVIVTVLDEGHALLSPTAPGRQGEDLPAADPVSFDIYEGTQTDFPAVMKADSRSLQAHSRHGFVFDRKVGADAETPIYGASFTHLEHVKFDRSGTNRRQFEVTLSGTNVVGLPFDPEDTYSIYPELSSDAKGPISQVGTLLRILNGPHAGWYRVQKTHSAPDQVEVLTLFGDAPVLNNPGPIAVYGAFYNHHFSIKPTWRGKPSDPMSGYGFHGAHLFHDTYEEEDKDLGSWDGVSGVLSVNWRGTGCGVRMVLNDHNFVAYDNGDGAEGPSQYLKAYSPATGPLWEVYGALTGQRLKRSNHGLHIKAYTNAANYSEEPAYSGWDSFGERIVQTGKDPALVVVADPSDQRFAPNMSFPAAFLLGSNRGTIGKAGAAEILGSVYLAVGRTGADDWDDGAFYAETGVGAGRWLHPLVGVTPQYPYEGQSPWTNWYMPTSLGQPGCIVEGTTYAVEPPNYTLFNYPHTGVFTVPELDEPLSRWVGTRIEPTSAVNPDIPDAIVGAEFNVIGLRRGVGVSYLAVYRHSATITVPNSGNADLLGQRWYEGYLNIADWALIGSKFFRSERALLPLLTISFPAAFLYGTLPFGPGKEVEGLLGALTYPQIQDGVGVGAPKPLADMPTVAAGTDQADAWGVDVNGQKEPRAPFPNVGAIVGGVPYGGSFFGDVLDATHPGHLQISDIYLEHLAPPFSNGEIAGYSKDAGGCLTVIADPFSIPGGLDTLKLWFRGTRLFVSKHYEITVVLILSGPVGKQITPRLETSSGVQVGWPVGFPTITLGPGNLPQQFILMFQVNDLDDRVSDQIQDSMPTAGSFPKVLEGVSLTLEFEMDTNPGADSLHVYQVRPVYQTAPALIGAPLDVAGPLRAASYRHVTPVRGFQTLGPADVELLANTEYAKYFEHEYLERHDVGIVLDDVTPDVWRKPVFDRHLFFKKGVHNASVNFFHPFFDPFWYPYVRGGGILPAFSEYVLPGRTGFLVPLDPPHGSYLSTLALFLSFLPSFSDGTLGGVKWQVWFTTPSGEAPPDVITWPSWQNPGDWEACEGVKLRLWRYNALDFGYEMPTGAGGYPPPPGPPPINTPRFGYSDLIYEEDISLASTPGEAGSENYNYSLEVGIQKLVLLAGDLPACPDRSLLIVDRRHFSYAMTIEFWGGRRNVSLGQFAYDNPDLLPRFNPSVGVLGFNSVIPDYPELNYDVVRAPVVKFRGARLGWITDRAGHGGWG